VSPSSKTEEPAGERIEPAAFRPAAHYRSQGLKKLIRWVAVFVLALALCLSGGIAWFVMTARQVLIQIEPVPEEVKVAGGLAAPRVGEHFLMRPGDYSLTARKSCYRELRHRFRVDTAERQRINLVMEKLPGELMVTAHREDHPDQRLKNIRIRIDGKEIGPAPLAAFEVDAGSHQLEITAQNYKALRREVTVDGCGKLQELDLALTPGWSNVTISSRPPGATVEIDGEAVAQTPARLELAEGSHELALKSAGYKTWRRKLEISANQPVGLEDIELEPADGSLVITTVPPGASVKIGNRAAGQTPLNMDLAPNKDYLIEISKPGFESARRTARLKSAESKAISITLTPRTGRVGLVIEPQDAELWIDGVKQESSRRQLELAAVEHDLEVKKKGYVTYRKRILPRPGQPLELRIALEPVAQADTTAANRIKAPNGYGLVLVSPAEFTMGSSRREQGRRSNETLRTVKLTRPFYMGTREVTNREFRQFQADHRSGRYQGLTLDDDQLPVAQVSWEQAALFCNWLSARASLEPVYVLKGGRLWASDRIGTGYRLPTEAEWEYAARIVKGPSKAGIKFPWGSGFPPPKGSGNFADVSAKDVLASYLETYNDGYAVSAPPQKFRANQLGLYDLGGNVAEWCHDYYDISGTGREQIDPTGPEEGRHHVVRGSSWKDGTISTLRLAYRDYSDSKRPDLGFRVARYAK